MERDDRGATAVILAFVLLLLMGVAAVAVDLARGWNERRQDQTSADIAAVAGALSFGTTTNAIADEVMDAARDNLDTTYSDGEWDTLWIDCDGSSRPEPFIAAPSSIGTIDCIGLNPSFLWVKLPDQFVDTSFGRVLGVDTLAASAETTVTLTSDSGGGALPFAIKSSVPPGQICLETGTGGAIEDPCEDSESGSFGNLAPQMFGNESLNTVQWCRNNPGTASFDNIAQAIAMGIDHALFPFPPPFDAGTWQDSDERHTDLCNETTGNVAEPADGVPINTVFIDTGNHAKDEVTEGLITGGTYPDGDGPRLTRFSAGADTRVVLGVEVDDSPLWKYLLPGNSGACDPAGFAGLDIDEKNDRMQECLDDHTGGTIFSDDILNSPRIGIAPRLWHDSLPEGNSEPRPIETFEVVYIHGIWLKSGGTAIPFFPDDPGSDLSSAGTPVEQTSAFLLDKSMVSEHVHEQLGGFTNDTWQPEIYQ